MVYEILGPMFFAETNDYLAFTHEKHKNVLILRMRDVPAMDITGLESLEEAYKPEEGHPLTALPRERTATSCNGEGRFRREARRRELL